MRCDIAVPPDVIVYHHNILTASMTFVKSHAENLKRYNAVYVGGRRCPGLALDEARCITINRHGSPREKVEEMLFRCTGFAPQFYRRIRSRQPRLVHAHFGQSALAGLRIARRARCPLIVTFHGQDATISKQAALGSFRGREMLFAKRRLAQEAGAIIAVSSFIRDRLLEAGYPPDKVVLHYNGVDTSQFAPDRSVPREKVILFVGRLVEKKGCSYLLEALRELHSRIPDARVVILGDGPEAPKLARLAAGLPVDFLGFQPLDVVKRWMNRASVLALPSVTGSDGDSEGLPTVQIEAQSMELPVVGTRHSGIPEGLIDGRTGYLIAERDSSALAERIGVLLSEPARLRQFGENARGFVRANFDLTRQLDKLEDLYDRVVDAGRS